MVDVDQSAEKPYTEAVVVAGSFLVVTSFFIHLFATWVEGRPLVSKGLWMPVGFLGLTFLVLLLRPREVDDRE